MARGVEWSGVGWGGVVWRSGNCGGGKGTRVQGGKTGGDAGQQEGSLSGSLEDCYEEEGMGECDDDGG